MFRSVKYFLAAFVLVLSSLCLSMRANAGFDEVVCNKYLDLAYSIGGKTMQDRMKVLFRDMNSLKRRFNPDEFNSWPCRPLFKEYYEEYKRNYDILTDFDSSWVSSLKKMEGQPNYDKYHKQYNVCSKQLFEEFFKEYILILKFY